MLTRGSRKIVRGLASPILIFLLLLIVVFSLSSPFFFDLENFQNVFIQASTIGILALGLTFVMINGNIDLSVGSTLGLTSAVFVIFYNRGSFGLAFTLALSVGVLIGLLHGLIMWLSGINSFITTLASMIGIKGLLFLVTKENSITLNHFEFTDLSTTYWLGMPALGWFYLILATALYLLQKYTVHGRNLFYIGGNHQAARDSGIAVNLHQLGNFVLCSVFAAIAGVLLCSQLGASTPNTGKGYELWAIAAAAIGGIKLTGGVGSIVTVFLGGLTIGVLRNGMSLLHVSSSFIYIVVGGVLLAVLIVDKYYHKSLTDKQLEEVSQ